MKYFVIEDENIKEEICRNILVSLPDWFGIPQAIEDYAEACRSHYFLCVSDDMNENIGFISMKFNNPYTSEIFVMGLKKEYHGKGIGSELVRLSEVFSLQNGRDFLHVKTLGESRANEHYRLTRKFYEKCGFIPVDELHGYWDEYNPCLLMIKKIG